MCVPCTELTLDLRSSRNSNNGPTPESRPEMPANDSVQSISIICGREDVDLPLQLVQKHPDLYPQLAHLTIHLQLGSLRNRPRLPTLSENSADPEQPLVPISEPKKLAHELRKDSISFEQFCQRSSAFNSTNLHVMWIFEGGQQCHFRGDWVRIRFWN